MALRNSVNEDKTDLEKCKEEISAILIKYHAYLMDMEENRRGVLLVDLDTQEILNAQY